MMTTTRTSSSRRFSWASSLRRLAGVKARFPSARSAAHCRVGWAGLFASWSSVDTKEAVYIAVATLSDANARSPTTCGTVVQSYGGTVVQGGGVRCSRHALRRKRQVAQGMSLFSVSYSGTVPAARPRRCRRRNAPPAGTAEQRYSHTVMVQSYGDGTVVPAARPQRCRRRSAPPAGTAEQRYSHTVVQGTVPAARPQRCRRRSAPPAGTVEQRYSHTVVEGTVPAVRPRQCRPRRAPPASTVEQRYSHTVVEGTVVPAVRPRQCRPRRAPPAGTVEQRYSQTVVEGTVVPAARPRRCRPRRAPLAGRGWP
eukprot:263918-Prorocentrum_minimum.AAC.1